MDGNLAMANHIVYQTEEQERAYEEAYYEMAAKNQPTLKRYYFQNAIFCGECTGAGCRRCMGSGIESLSEFLMYRKGDPIALRAQYTACLKEEMLDRKL